MGNTQSQGLTVRQRSAKVYTDVTTPFDYVDGYHFLMQHLQGRYVCKSCIVISMANILFRFDKMDILRIVRALAIFRPSLIALQMDLTTEDEIFAEKCFQRSLLVRYGLCSVVQPNQMCPSTGIRETYLLQRDAYSGLAPHRRDLSRWRGVLDAD